MISDRLIRIVLSVLIYIFWIRSDRISSPPVSLSLCLSINRYTDCQNGSRILDSCIYIPLPRCLPPRDRLVRIVSGRRLARTLPPRPFTGSLNRPPHTARQLVDQASWQRGQRRTPGPGPPHIARPAARLPPHHLPLPTGRPSRAWPSPPGAGGARPRNPRRSPPPPPCGHSTASVRGLCAVMGPRCRASSVPPVLARIPVMNFATSDHEDRYGVTRVRVEVEGSAANSRVQLVQLDSQLNSCDTGVLSPLCCPGRGRGGPPGKGDPGSRPSIDPPASVGGPSRVQALAGPRRRRGGQGRWPTRPALPPGPSHAANWQVVSAPDGPGCPSIRPTPRQPSRAANWQVDMEGEKRENKNQGGGTGQPGAQPLLPSRGQQPRGLSFSLPSNKRLQPSSLAGLVLPHRGRLPLGMARGESPAHRHWERPLYSPPGPRPCRGQ